MTEGKNEKRGGSTGLWVLALLGTAVICFALSAGVAYSGIRAAQLTAAKASLGHIEATLLLAERYAEDNGYGPAPEVYSGVLKSYEDASYNDLTPQEKYVIDTMVDSFGEARGFDFAVTRVRDGAGVMTQIYYFPVRGKTNARSDNYYLMSAGEVVEKNG